MLPKSRHENIPRNDAGYFVGYLHRYFVRYLASNDESFLSGSLPNDELGPVPRSLPSRSPHSRPSSFPEYSTNNLETDAWDLLERNDEGPGARYELRKLFRPGLTRGFDKKELVPTLSVTRKWTT